MGKLIDEQTAYDVLTDYYHHSTDTQHAALREALGRVETVDAVPVVRCKDCKHRDPEDRKCDCGHDIMWQLPRGDDWYCADGERKDGDHAEGTIQKERS